tara:strand:+ start:79 stop:825 length:747 start_codon:yes stop_codon:yes gene_type:complete
MSKQNKSNLKSFKSVFILGGTSEIAQEICLNLAQKGTKRIHFVSRKKSKINSFIKRLTNEFTLEITHQEYDLLNEDFKTLPKVGFFDLYIIASGYLGNSTLANDDLDEALNIAKVNYYSLIPWINSITSKDRVSKPGAMWILSSVAGDRGRPSNYHYGAAKAALTIFCEGLFHRLHKKPFKIRIIKAGLIYTSMTIGKAPKILCARKQYIAKILINKPYKEGIEYLPFWWFLVMKIILILPKSVISKL